MTLTCRRIDVRVALMPSRRLLGSYRAHLVLVATAGGWRSAAALAVTVLSAALATAAVVLTGAVVGAATAALAGRGSAEHATVLMAWLAAVLVATPVTQGVQLV